MSSLSYAQQQWESPPDDPEEGEIDLTIDGHPVTVYYSLAGEYEPTVDCILIGTMLFDAYTFAGPTIEYLEAQIRSKIYARD